MLIVDAFKRWWEMLTKPKAEPSKAPEQLFGRVQWKSAAEEEQSSRAIQQVAVTLQKPPEPPAAEVIPKVKPARPLKRRKPAKK